MSVLMRLPLIISAMLVLACGPVFAGDVPVPTPRPQVADEIPIPELKPGAPSRVDMSPNVSTPPALPIQKPAFMSAACEAELKSLGVRYAKPTTDVDPMHGCRIDQPVELRSLADGVDLTPPAVLDCPTAVHFAVFARASLQDIAVKHLGARIKSVQHASAFVCRPRNGTSKLSEHAFGRAIDLASFTTKTGLLVPVMAMPKDREIEAGFLTAVRLAACGPFATVLGPGSNADHATHFHFDLAPRKGSAYCR
jgi:hypothetical protein